MARPAWSWRRAAAIAAAAGLGLAAYQAGALFVDPVGRTRRANELLLRGAGAGEEFFRNEDGRRVRVWRLGPLSAEVPVVLLHGLGATGDYWSLAALELARAGRTVLLPDFPGSGGSEPPERPGGYGLPARVATVASLASALGLERFDLVGHSLGGWTAGLFAIQEPRSVRRLVLVDPGGLTRPDDVAGMRASLTPRDRAGAERLLDLLFFRKPLPVTGFVLNGLARNYLGPCVVVTLDRLSEADALLGREAELPPGTILIWGERDTLFPVSDGRRTLGRLRDGRLLVLTGVGHDGPLEAPWRFREALFAALGRSRAA